VAVGFQWGEDDVHQPQAEEQAGREDLRDSRTSELPANHGPAAIEQDSDADEGEDGEECDREGECSRIHPELSALCVVVNGSDGPGYTNPQEDIDGVTSCHVADGGVCILVLDSCHFTGEGIWTRQWRADKMFEIKLEQFTCFLPNLLIVCVLL